MQYYSNLMVKTCWRYLTIAPVYPIDKYTVYLTAKENELYTSYSMCVHIALCWGPYECMIWHMSAISPSLK